MTATRTSDMQLGLNHEEYAITSANIARQITAAICSAVLCEIITLRLHHKHTVSALLYMVCC